MQKLEIFRNSLVALVGEAHVHQLHEGNGKGSSELRKERRKGFLDEADRLLMEYGFDQAEKGMPLQRLTLPITLLVADNVRVPFEVQIQIGRSSVSLSRNGVRGRRKYTEILAKYSDTGEKRSLFSVEENSSEHLRQGEEFPCRVVRNTIIRNKYRGIASNDQVLEGFRAINFIASQFSKNHNSIPTT